MRALITGARGFIGSALAEVMAGEKFDVRCLLRRNGTTRAPLTDSRFHPIEGDITIPSTLRAAVEDVDYVFHLAGATKALRKRDFDTVNINGTRSLLEATRRHNPRVKRFVLVSSLAAAGPSLTGKLLVEDDPAHPISDYGRSKLGSEAAADAYRSDLPITVIRPPAVFGPRDTDMLNLFKYTKRGLRPVLSGGPRYASLVYVKDLVCGIFLSSQKDIAIGQTYYLCNDSYYSWEALADCVEDIMETKTIPIKVPLVLARLMFAANQLIGRLSRRATILNLDKFRELQQTHWICDNAKAKQELDFHPKFTLKEALVETRDWYLRNGWL